MMSRGEKKKKIFVNRHVDSVTVGGLGKRLLERKKVITAQGEREKGLTVKGGVQENGLARKKHSRREGDLDVREKEKAGSQRQFRDP